MERKEIIERLERIAKHAVHTAEEPLLVMSLDDGIALITAVDAFEKMEGWEWIPCSARLPKEDQEVLATTNWGDVTYAWRYDRDKWFIHEGNTNATTDDILAWMPLPEPYAERREE